VRDLARICESLAFQGFWNEQGLIPIDRGSGLGGASYARDGIRIGVTHEGSASGEGVLGLDGVRVPPLLGVVMPAGADAEGVAGLRNKGRVGRPTANDSIEESCCG
jgi:hypothetical protein